MENKSFNAIITAKHNVIALIICYIIVIAITLLGSVAKNESEPHQYKSWGIETKEEDKTYYLLFMECAWVKKDLTWGSATLSKEIYTGKLLLGLFIEAALFIMPAVFVAVNKNMAGKCSLELNGDGIKGDRKMLFSSKNLNLPMEQIDALMVSEGLFDKISGGKTIVIRSASGVIKFPWVQNADEFVSRTLDEIKKFKESINKQSVPAPAPAAPAGSSELEQLQKLKDLLDSGVITQEEFEAKKKQLLSL